MKIDISKIKLSNNIIALIALALMLVSLYSNLFAWQSYEPVKLTTKAVVSTSGNITLCINKPPIPDLGACSSSATVDSAYSCDVNLRSGLSDTGETLTFSDNTTLFNIVSSSGLISFTPQSNETGTYSINITVSDNIACSNNIDYGILNLTISTAPPPAPGPGPAAGAGGGGAGFGFHLPSKKADFSVEPTFIKVLVKLGESLEKELKIKNTGEIDLVISLAVPNLAALVSFSEARFILPIGQEKIIKVKFAAPEDTLPGAYIGRILVKGEAATGETITKLIDVIDEIESRKVLFDLSLDIPPNYKVILPGQDILAQLTLFNLDYIGISNVSIEYQIKDMEGTMILKENETIAVETQASYEKVFHIPKETKPGDYVLIAIARFGDSFGTSSKLFEIREEEKLVPPGKDYTFLLLLIIGLLLIMFGFLAYDHARKKDHKFLKLRLEKLRLQGEARKAKFREKEIGKKEEEKRAQLKLQREKLRLEEKRKREEQRKIEKEIREKRKADKRLRRRKALRAFFRRIGVYRTKEEREMLKKKRLEEKLAAEESKKKLKELEEEKKSLEKKRLHLEELEKEKLLEEKKMVEEEKKKLEQQKKSEDAEKRRLIEGRRAEEQREKALQEKEYQGKRDKLLKQLKLLEEGYKAEFISKEAYEKDKEKIEEELEAIGI